MDWCAFGTCDSTSTCRAAFSKATRIESLHCVGMDEMTSTRPLTTVCIPSILIRSAKYAVIQELFAAGTASVASALTLSTPLQTTLTVSFRCQRAKASPIWRCLSSGEVVEASLLHLNTVLRNERLRPA